MKRPSKDGHLQTMEGETQSAVSVTLDFWPPELLENISII